MFIVKLIQAILRALGLLSPVDRDSHDLKRMDNPDVTLSQNGDIEPSHYPYRLRDDFLSAAERNFFHVLSRAVGDEHLICAKVNLADLFYVSSRDPIEYRSYTNKIDRKHVDYVLCDPQTLTPLLGVELDDSSHKRSDRQQRDHFVDNVFAASGLPLLRVKVQRSYAISELEEALLPYLGKHEPQNVQMEEVSAPIQTTERSTTTWETTSEVHAESTAPTCPRCGDTMVLRIGRSGANAGQHFWGCSNYPRCKSIRVHSAAPAPD